MILFSRKRIDIGNDEVTIKRLDGFIVMYNTPAKGFLESWLIGVRNVKDDEGVVISYDQVGKYFPQTFSDMGYKNIDVLEELHRYYTTELQVLNPDVIFTTQIIKPV